MCNLLAKRIVSNLPIRYEPVLVSQLCWGTLSRFAWRAEPQSPGLWFGHNLLPMVVHCSHALVLVSQLSKIKDRARRPFVFGGRWGTLSRFAWRAEPQSPGLWFGHNLLPMVVHCSHALVLVSQLSKIKDRARRPFVFGGRWGTRTLDLPHVTRMLYQLS